MKIKCLQCGDIIESKSVHNLVSCKCESCHIDGGNEYLHFGFELDAKLHTLLTRYIINLFHNSDTNKGNGQLIYSTHDTVNLNKDTF